MDNDKDKGMDDIENMIRGETPKLFQRPSVRDFLVQERPVQEQVPESVLDQEPTKIDHTFLPLDALNEVSRALMHGEQIYAANLWVTNPHRHRDLLAKALRHIFAFQSGETIDKSGLQHIACAICDLMFLQSNILRGTGTDDRLIYPEKDK
jgi:hypothetical protein